MVVSWKKALDSWDESTERTKANGQTQFAFWITKGSVAYLSCWIANFVWLLHCVLVNKSITTSTYTYKKKYESSLVISLGLVIKQKKEFLLSSEVVTIKEQLLHYLYSFLRVIVIQL